MKISVIKTFHSKSLGLCKTGDVITCDDAIGASIIGSKLGAQLTDNEQPVVKKQKRKTKQINKRIIETGAMQVETT